MAEISKETIKAYALENATKHKGKASPGAILAGLFAEGLEKSQIKEISPVIQEITKKVNSMSLEKQQKELSSLDKKTSKRKIREGLPELPNAKQKKVIMRIAPFPSGPLHIGNTRQLILNDEYCKTYNGKLILAMDDTIGSEKKPLSLEAYPLIEEGIKWLDVKYDKKIFYKSDHIERYYKYAEEMIKKEYIYICDCEIEKMHDNKIKGIECSCRQYPGEKQIERWKKMFTAPEGSICARLKTSMQDPDPAFRDRVMFRISDRPHPKLGTKYRVYPLLDFSWAIDDHLLGITHIVRGIDLMMESRVEKFIWDIFNWPHPEIIHTGLLKIEGLKISKSKGAREVKSGEYIGWNDPRTWSLQSLKDRGLQPQAIREFILSLGIRKTNITTPIENLYAINKRNLGETPRYFFIENPEKITIKGCPPLETKIPKHPSGRLGSRTIKTTQDFLISEEDFYLLDNQEYRLLHLLTFKSQKTGIKPRDFSFVSTEPTGKTKFLHWLPATSNNIKAEILMPDGSTKSGLGEYELEKIKVGQIIYFERFGFCRLHKKEKESLEFWFTHE